MDIAKLIQSGAALIDVREPFEFAMGHVSNAVNIPLSNIPSIVNDLKQIEQPVVLYCQSGNRSGMAANFLQSQGMNEVYNGGGLRDMSPFM